MKISERVWQDPVYFIAFGFGSGLSPFMPGTWGTLAAIPLYLLLPKSPWFVYALIIFAAFLLGVAVSKQVTNALGEEDYPGIVWDEIVGYLITMFAAPVDWRWMLAGFLLFRLFDIWKPHPIRWIEQHVQGGLGVMLDDVLAAIPAWILLQLFIWVLR